MQSVAATKTKVELVLAAEMAKPGETVLAGVHLTMPLGWHTYWLNGGDAGAPTTIDWKLPPGITAGNIQWPVPEKYDTEGLFSYVYHDEVYLLVPLQIAANTPPGNYNLKAKVAWLECENTCLPGEKEVTASLTIGNELKPSASAKALQSWQDRIPPLVTNPPVQVAWEAPNKNERALNILWQVGEGFKTADFFPLPEADYEVMAATTVIPATAGTLGIRKVIKQSKGKWPNELHGLLIAKGDNKTSQAIEVRLNLNPSPTPPANTKTTAPPNTNPTSPSLGRLATMLWLAFLGGLILNIMPCVLPVIALKIFGFVNQSQESPSRVRKLGLVYAVGVLVSFLVLGGAVIAVKHAGQAASWGMQYQNTTFVMLMTVMVLLVALNLFGVFEVSLGGRALNSASELAGKEGTSGAFFNGVLATALATPCTAPFLGAALGFAFTQSSAWIILLIFLAVGCGLATPYVLLSWNPGWLRFLPKPGAWMEKFKQAMGFPMLATALWLYTQLIETYGGGSEWWLALFLVFVAMSAWVWGAFVQRGQKRQLLGGLIALGLLVSAYGYILESQLHWRTPPVTQSSSHNTSPKDGIAWQAWSPEAISSARTQGRPILVDFTASWCLTCQVNLKTSIEIPEVRNKLKAINAVALIEDSRVKNAQVVAELNRYGRAGVPLVLVYPKNPNTPPIVLPEVLTPGIVLDALDKAAQ
jgi:thiol:disulfide interchange protein DsbD